ncbi:L,D-transpeptidase family protein [Chelativorans sp. Marseille-P2723]|uniref:L,D-transpeptidase family protein n=1 Tax=Chelativorans sp. Marseille-P2723 TaxID=2709133 RepID=UPI00156F7CD1|nr:L,D-transpeptidase family protein [Chelativorans sp. Marseille-P2723]
MSGKIALRGSLSVMAVAAGLSMAAVPAAAEQYLIDLLFNQHRSGGQPVTQGSQRREVAPRSVPKVTAPRTRAAAVPAPKISAPSYYDYKPDPLVKVGFGALLQVLFADVAETGDEKDPFLEALPELADHVMLAEREIGEALVAHYSRAPEFIWVDTDGPNERAASVIRVLENAAGFGLSEADYLLPVPSPAAGSSKNRRDRLRELIRFEMALSTRALRYARDANTGRVNPNKLSGYHDFPTKPLDEQAVLGVLARTPSPARYLEALHPQNALYAELRKELKALRDSEEREIIVDPETFVRPGQSHAELPKILRLLKSENDPQFQTKHGEILVAHAGSEFYAQELVPVIKAVQRLYDLNPDGVIGRRTVGAIAGDSKAVRIEKVLLAMERLRWHPSHLGSRRVMINAASFSAHYIEGEKEKLSMRAVVGTRANQTNSFYDEIEYVEYNPYWGVPRSILVNEKLPRLRQDPGYLDRAGYEVVDSRGRRVSSASVDWWRYGANIPYNVRQKPGPSNALGEVKIMFPNKHDIYMHDTPAKSLFSRDTRAYSHGCVRLQNPREMAAAVLGTSVNEVGRRISEGRNARQNVPQKIPVYVSYFTAWPEPSGSGVSYHDDIYGRDDALKKALAKVEELRAAGS